MQAVFVIISDVVQTANRLSLPRLCVVRHISIAAIATKFTIFGADELASVKLESGRTLGTQLETHRHNRVEQLCFRRSPAAYLADLEAQIIQ